MQKYFLLLFVFFLSLQKSLACDCKTIPLSEASIKNVELIFLGDVVAVSGCNGTSKVSFHVKELYRGKCFEETSIEFDCSSDCQMSFVPGQTWLIYATYKKYGEAIVDFCSYSRQQFASEKDDFNTIAHGMNFSDEKNWLKKTVGIQKLNVKDVGYEQHHENIRPQGFEILWYLAAGFIGLLVFYFLGRKFLK
jgi:hypothetical protein